MSASTLEQKLDQARMVIEEAFDAHPPEKTLIAWSAGKDSTLVLRLILDVCQARGLRPPVALDIDQRDQFEELIELRDRVAREWGVEVRVVSNSDFLERVRTFGDQVGVAALSETNKDTLREIGYAESTVTWEPESPVCNHLLKTVPINQAITTRGIEAVFTGIRWDEHGARGQENYFSPREQPPHLRVHPILHFSERDVWDATFALGIPHCSLYLQGYRSLGTKSGTKKPASIPAWEQDLELTSERDGRSVEKEQMMDQLRAWGYL